MNNIYSNWAQYFDPSAFNTPSGGGNHSSGGDNTMMNMITNPTNPMNIGGFNPGDPLGFMDGLFGGGGSSWNPYIDANGNYVYADPNRANPVPVSQVPGANLKPNKTYRDMANNISALTTLYPQYAAIIAGQAIPQAQAALAAAQATAPGWQQLASNEALAQVRSDAGALTEAQKNLIPQALAAQKMLDPEYYATRELTGQKLNELLQGMGPTVEREIGQGLAQQDAQRGLLNAPSQLAAVSGAMQYGREGRDALTSAIAAATSAMPTLRSGSDAFQVATGRSSTPVFGNGASGLTNSTSLGQNYLNQTVSTQQNNAQLAMQNKLQSKDWADYLGQVTSSIGNLTSAAGGAAGLMCWIARRVYGVNNPLWKKFRDYMLNDAPKELREYYIKHGEAIANKLTDSQCVLIRTLMNKILGEIEYV